MTGVKVIVVAGYGINADFELEEAFRRVGADAERVHLADLIADPERIVRSGIVAFPGGFSFGDHLGSGLVFAARFRHHLGAHFSQFLQEGGLAIGICNGFQILVKMGVLPDMSGNGDPEVTLVHNQSGKFVDRWVRVRFEQSTVWTKGLSEMDLPVRHGEGRFVCRDDAVLHGLNENKLVALRYSEENPNGSQADIAGITDRTGRIIGLMPHPEAFRYPENHPRWGRDRVSSPEGLELLRNGVDEAKHN